MSAMPRPSLPTYSAIFQAQFKPGELVTPLQALRYFLFVMGMSAFSSMQLHGILKYISWGTHSNQQLGGRSRKTVDLAY